MPVEGAAEDDPAVKLDRGIVADEMPEPVEYGCVIAALECRADQRSPRFVHLRVVPKDVLLLNLNVGLMNQFAEHSGRTRTVIHTQHRIREISKRTVDALATADRPE